MCNCVFLTPTIKSVSIITLLYNLSTFIHFINIQKKTKNIGGVSNNSVTGCT